MPIERRGKYLIVSRPRHKRDLDLWSPYATVSWRDDADYYRHEISNLGISFDRHEEALAYGFKFAHKWINNNFGVP